MGVCGTVRLFQLLDLSLGSGRLKPRAEESRINIYTNLDLVPPRRNPIVGDSVRAASNF